ncbi:response regulator [Paenibacillus sp. IB182496]|uniref:Response regulator n=1 Tax=Paenibacillus sabuli TaxID=2772509 RepID=A0A927BSM9_9BACL|nr:response regulator [Paenibacillus sabuli]MBD2845557.1 response regulator [Paenibacillus sabuli]
MKYQVVLIDDERYLRMGLRKLIADHTVSWQVAGEAGNGEDGLRLIEELHPSLAIVDIRMPIMDGIALARAVYSRGLSTRVIILTGFKDFEYARSAIKYGVLDFLLKPCAEEDLVRALDQAFAIVDKERRQRLLNMRLLEENALRNAFLGLPLEQEQRRLLEQFATGASCCFLTGLSGAGGKLDGETALLHFAVRNIVEEMAESERTRLYMVMLRHDIAALLIDTADTTSRPDWLGRLTDTLAELLGVFPKLVVSSGIQRVEQLANLAAPVVGSGLEEVESAAELEELLNRAQLLFEEWLDLIGEGNLKTLRERAAAELRCLQEEIPPNAVRRCVYMIAAALDKLSRRVMNEPLEELVSLSAPEREREEAVRQLQRVVDRFFQRLDAWQSEHNRNTIRQVIEFVERHYAGVCNLSAAAEHVHFNPTYLSTMFKKETGEGFVNYVTKRRMSQAKLLLANTDLKITEISSRIGYDDPNYFTRTFRKVCGVAPNQFRKGQLS